MKATPSLADQLVEYLAAIGIRAEVTVRADSERYPSDGIALWRSQGSRPVDGVWMPCRRRDTFLWGASLDRQLPGATPLRDVAEHIAASLKDGSA